MNATGNYTDRGWNAIYDTVDNDYFKEKDAELIYESLEKQLKPVPFGKYLKRYIREKTGITEAGPDPFSLKDYQTIIMDAFRDHQTPASFTPTTAKLSALCKNWLTQQNVKRQVVLLLGFGLGMSPDDVNMLLVKGLHEPVMNQQDPFEMICAYCYDHRYGYYKFEQLWAMYEKMQPETLDMKLIYEAQPVGRQESVWAAHDDAQLMARLLSMKSSGGTSRAADTAYQMFMTLYDQARELIVAQYNQESRNETEIQVRELRERLNRNDRLYEEDRQEKLRQAKAGTKVWTKEDITESDLEHILCSSIPLDRHGNLTPAKMSSLFSQFEGKRFSRKHLNDILHRRVDVERFDLITVNFLIHAETVDREPNANKRYNTFIEQTNTILQACGMGPVYVANPYECFVLMCILSVSPLETYADVMEMSYEQSCGGGEK